MDLELTKYESLADPAAPKNPKFKAAPVSSTLGDLLQQLKQARDSLAAHGDHLTPAQIQQLMTKTASNIEKSKSLIDDRLKETHASATRLAKHIDKRFPGSLPEQEPLFQDAKSQAALQKTVLQHLVRAGDKRTAEVFSRECRAVIDDRTKDVFSDLHVIISDLRKGDITKALHWAQAQAPFLKERKSPLEFHLHQSQYLHLLTSSHLHPMPTAHPAMRYLTENLLKFHDTYPDEVKRLAACLLWNTSLANSPYADLASTSMHSSLVKEFTKEYSACHSISQQPPLAIVSNIGGGSALVRIEKGKKLLKDKKGDWTNEMNELPVEIPLEPEHHFHSVFTCPVSKDQATESNPPMMLICGHVLVKESMEKLCRGSRLKCPYCPVESVITEILRVRF